MSVFTLQIQREVHADHDLVEQPQSAVRYTVIHEERQRVVVELDWGDAALKEELRLLRTVVPRGAARASLEPPYRKLSARLGRLLASTPLPDMLRRLAEIEAAGGPGALDLVLHAAELTLLPWDALELDQSGVTVAQSRDVLVRLRQGGRPCVPPAPQPANRAGRVLVAWSKAGGGVPDRAHVEALVSAADGAPALAGNPRELFDARCDTLPGCGLVSLRRKLTEARGESRPYTILHLLCHGVAQGTGGALLLDDPEGQPQVVDGPTLTASLLEHAPHLRLVVLLACSAGGSGELASPLGGVAHHLQKAGFQTVISARAALSIDGSIAFAQELWRQLLQEFTSVERAFTLARDSLTDLWDRRVLALHGWPDAGEADTRPIQMRPYRGLYTFGASDHALFFGRTRQTDAMLEQVQGALQKSGHLVVVTGASGSGKSSLARAGLIPRLSAIGGWQVRELDLTRDLGLQISAQDTRPSSVSALWLVDPLDLLFTAERPPGEDVSSWRRAVATELVKLASRPGEVVLCTLRPDLLSRCADVTLDDRRRLDAVIYGANAVSFLAAPEPGDLHAAIEGPARRVGLRLVQGLTDALIADAGDAPSALPLLQYVLDQLWVRRSGRELTLLAYEELGRLGGALASTASAVVDQLSEPVREEVWRILLELVQFDEDGPPRRRVMRVAQIRPATDEAARLFDHALRALASARLVVVDGERVELAHEALLRQWDRLRRLAQDQRDRRQAAQHVESAVAVWVGDGRGDRYLERNAARWGYYKEIAERAWPTARPEDVSAFLDASERLLNVELIYKQTLADRARDAALVLMASNALETDPTLATQLLREVSPREQGADWTELAWKTLRRPVCVERRRVPQGIRSLHAHRNPRDPGCWLVPTGPAVVIHQDGAKTDELVLRPSSEAVADAAWAPDGERVLVRTAGGAVSLWRATGQLERQLVPPTTAPITFAAFHPTGTQVLVATSAGKIWLMPTRDEPPRLVGYLSGGLRLAVWSPAGDVIATVCEARPYVVSLFQGDAESALDDPESRAEIRALAFHPDGQTLLAVCADGVARRWSLTGGPPARVRLGGELSAAVWVDGGREIWVGSRDGQLFHWRDAVDGAVQPSPVRPSGAAICDIASGGAGTVVSLAEGGNLETWRRRDAVGWGDGLAQLDAHPTAVALAREGQWVVAGSQSGQALVIEVTTRAQHRLPGRTAGGRPFAIGPVASAPGADPRVAIGARDNRVELWDIAAMSRLHVLEVRDLLGLAWSQDGLRIAAWDSTGRLELLDPRGGQTPTVLLGHGRRITQVVWSADGRALWSASLDETLRRWEGGRQTHQVGVARTLNQVPVGPPEHRLTAMALRPQQIVIGTASGAVRLLSETLAPQVELGRLARAVSAVGTTPDGHLIAAGDESGEVRIWRRGAAGYPLLRTWRPSGDPERAAERLERLRFTPCTRRLALEFRTGGNQVRTDLLLLDGSERSARLPGHWDLAAFHPQGDWMAAADGARGVALHPLSTAEIRARLVEHTPVPLPEAVRAQLMVDPVGG